MKDHPETLGVSRVRSILIIDDHPLYRDALVAAIESFFANCAVKTATTLGEGLSVLEGPFAPDLVMLDLKLPDVQGISGFLTLRERIPETPILIISALSSGDVVRALMEAGAAGFVTKDACAQDLKTALYDVRAGRKYLPHSYEQPCRSTLYDSRLEEGCDKLADLTPQQARIMKLICAGKPNKQIAYELSLAEATVKAHITALLRRLGVQNRTQAAVLAESVHPDRGAPLGDADARAFLSH